MGGNVFPNLKRLQKQDYDNLVVEVVNKLQQNLFYSGATIIAPTRSYYTKESFGDMDLVVASDNLVPDYLVVLKQVFNLADGDVSKNGNVVSFRLYDFQIDLLLTSCEDWRSTYDYFSWNDLSNLMGRITYKHGLKFGHRGVFVTVRDGTHEIGEILVTRSVQDLCDYFGWNYYQWNDGFATMEDAYKWLVETPYFNKDVFAYENRNHAAAIRDRKRPNYANFLVWLETQDNLPEYPYEDTVSKGGYMVRQPYFDMLCCYWPHVRAEYDAKIAVHEEQRQFKAKFNGGIVSEITGLEGKNLGEFMKYCKDVFTKNKHLKNWILQDHFSELVRQRFVMSLLWHFQEDEEYGKSTKFLSELTVCDNCDKAAVHRYFSFQLCDGCLSNTKKLDQHHLLA